MTFEPIEWSDEITELVEQLEEKAEETRLNRPERALMDVYQTVELLGPDGDGLHEFWQSALDHQRIINSFDMVGASAMVDVLNASKWCQTRHEDRDQYSETESEYLAGIEDEMHDAMAELPELVADFIEDEIGSL